MPTAVQTRCLKLALPKGRMQDGVFRLFDDAGITVRADARGYRPTIALPGIDTKILKPQNVVEMLQAGSRDVGFAGADWVAELNADLVEVLDTELDAVRLVAAAPRSIVADGRLPRRRIVVASEYERLTRDWIDSRGLDAIFVRSYGATEVFPPEDADCIVDIAASGETLRTQNLVIFDELMRSSTRLYANPRSLEIPEIKDSIDRLAMLLRSVIRARERVMIELNVSADSLDAIVRAIPCMREPTISPLHGGGGYAVKAAVPRQGLALLIPELKTAGGTDLVVSQLKQIIP